ncbi:HK97 family phage prohead protease [Clostridium botulinum]|uniref:HK97 family phage prohead protease n=1 Tax=Clostridium botulinum TaxID=1491 RepID=UPI00140044B2|nr:HK97 family phage prohead protease [Clostridium botulinum]MBY6835981.1 HK97 family phage prohead protease [Clostridium botulinum]MBY6929800.1 HK97 family phage prohead protease [Clostridium botulinum]NFG65764.1 HK97 family phage prohead protease [Clostridium botulinum]NFO40072.1 HK97 family phage prohead protease [Clostridium botulinum]NFQ22600.1 HK97 family phage prohead protease [Clostridium botulinum]
MKLNKEKEIRRFIADNLEVRESEENSNTKKCIRGYINKFNTRSQYMGFYEEVNKSAFDKTLADGHNIYAMYNHDHSKILGSTRSTSLKLYTDDIGLAFELEINNNISYVNDLYELVSNGDIDGCSFGFYVTNDNWSYTEEGIDLRIINELELIEVTITPFPAYLDSEASCRSFEIHREDLEKHKQNELRKKKIEIELELL